MDYKAGDLLEVKTKDDVFEGILIPQKDEFLVIKLDNGYNIGIDKRKIKEIKVLQRYIAKKKKK